MNNLSYPRRNCLLAWAGVLLALTLPIAVQAQFTYTTNNDNTITITGYTGSDGAVDIPAAINGLPVISIGAEAFAYGTVNSVTMADSVTDIGDSAFYECEALWTVTIGNGVTSIGNSAFADCYNLADLTIGGSVKSIGNSAFYNCFWNLTSVTIPDSVTNIEDSAFFACNNLTSVSIGNGVTHIGDSAFFQCEVLASVTIPPSVISIGDWAFDDCSSLTNVSIPDGVTDIGAGAFKSCPLLSSVTLPGSVTKIGDSLFEFCFNLTAITVDARNSTYCSVNGVLLDKNQTTLIEYPVDGPASYMIPNSVTSIAEAAFGSCYMLTNVTVPIGVASIGDNAFFDCSGLTSVFFMGNAPPSVGTNAFSRLTYPGIFLHDPATVYYLPGATGWDDFATNTGLPAALWFLPNPLILNEGQGFGVQSNQFGFVISWATNAAVVVEACADLAHPVWLPVATNTLISGSSYFSDPQWTTFPGRFYRLKQQ